MTIKEQILFNDMMDLINEQAREIDSLNGKLKKSRDNEFTSQDLYRRKQLEQEVEDLKYQLRKSKSTNSALCRAYNSKIKQIEPVNIIRKTVNVITNIDSKVKEQNSKVIYG